MFSSLLQLHYIHLISPFFATSFSLLLLHCFQTILCSLLDGKTLLRLMKLSRTWLRLTSIPWNALLHFPDEELRLLLCFFCKPSAAVQNCPRLALLTVKTNVCLTLELVLSPWCDKFSWLLKIKIVLCAIRLQFFNEISFESQLFFPSVFLWFHRLKSLCSFHWNCLFCNQFIHVWTGLPPTVQNFADLSF